MFCHVFHSEVFKAKHRQTGKKVALKKVLMENEKEGVREKEGRHCSLTCQK